MKEEALKLADELVYSARETYNGIDLEAADMIRRLVEELDKQGKPVAWMYSMALHPLKKGFSEVKPDDKYKPISLYTTPQTKPLSELEADEIAEMMADMYNSIRAKEPCSRGYSEQCDAMKEIYRAIEERHGIK
jgi:hypothetical protein